MASDQEDRPDASEAMDGELQPAGAEQGIRGERPRGGHPPARGLKRQTDHEQHTDLLTVRSTLNAFCIPVLQHTGAFFHAMLTLDIPFDTMSCEPPGGRLPAIVRNPHSIERNVADTRVNDQLIH